MPPRRARGQPLHLYAPGIFIPLGVLHRLQLVRGSGYLIVILRQGKYE